MSVAPQANVEALDGQRNHPLNVAAAHNNIEVLRLLIAAMSSVDQRDAAGDTALLRVRHTAAQPVLTRRALAALSRVAALSHLAALSHVAALSLSAIAGLSRP